MPRQGLGELLGRLADQVDRAGALGDGVGEPLEGLALERAADDQVEAAVERLDPGERRRDVGRLRVVDVERRRRARGRARGGAARPRSSAGPRRRRRAGRPLASAAAAAAIAFSTLWAPEQLQLGGRQQRLALPDEIAARQRQLAALAPRGRTRPARRRRAGSLRQRGLVAVVRRRRRPRPGWRRSAASRRGSPRASRGGRGGRARGSGRPRTRARSAELSSSWKLEHSQTTVASGSIPSSASDASGVPTLPATATGSPGRPVEVADQLGRRRLAVGAGDRAEAVRDQAPGELELAGHLDPALARRGDHRGVLGHAGALHHGAHVVEKLRSVHVQADFDACVAQPCRLVRRARIDAQHALAARGQQARHGGPRARQPDDQKRPFGQGRTWVPGVHITRFAAAAPSPLPEFGPLTRARSTAGTA